jgi:hypothetical protein
MRQSCRSRHYLSSLARTAISAQLAPHIDHEGSAARPGPHQMVLSEDVDSAARLVPN